MGVIALLLASCQGRGGVGEERPLVAVTIAPTASLVSELSGGSVRTLTLLPRGTAPELYEPAPQDLVSLSSAAAYLSVGDLGFERAWLERIGELYPNLNIISLDEGGCTHGEGHEGQGHTEPHDPHYWTSIGGMRRMARNTYQALVGAFPSQDSLFSARYGALEAELSTLEAELSERIARARSRAFVIYHPALTDFATEFALEQLALEQDGKEPSPMQLRALVERAKTLGVTTVFIQKEFDEKLARGIASELGARVVPINPLGEDWRSELRTIADAL